MNTGYVLEIKDINKKPGRKQVFLRNRWFNQASIKIIHSSIFLNEKDEKTQKKVQKA